MLTRGRRRPPVTLLNRTDLEVMLEGLGAGQPFLAVGWVPAGRIEGAIALRRAGPIDRHRFQSFEMPGRQLEGVCPYLLEEVAPAGDRCRVGWGHHHSGKGHQALLTLPLATSAATATTTAGRGKGTLTSGWARRRRRRRCRRRLLLCCCRIRKQLKGQRPTTSSAIAAALALGLVLRHRGPRSLGIGLEELGLLGSLHRSSSLDTSEEASVGGERNLHLRSLLEEITTRLDDLFSIIFEQHGAQIER